MNTEALFIFLILLLGLLLCSFLGGNCGREGLQNNDIIYYGPNGATITMSTNADGEKIITLNNPSDTQTIIFKQSSDNPNSYTNTLGFTATLINGNIVIYYPNNGTSQTFTPSKSNTNNYDNYNHYDDKQQQNTSTQYYGSTGYPIQQDQYALSYNDTLPKGIPASQILPGQEDLYILKSEVVPPVCPACPTSSVCPRQEPCPPCPACARCPEPSFECKKVPNYNAINNEYLPTPVLNDFSQFGM